MQWTGAILVCFGVSAALAQSSLTGIWTADDGGVYYVRQTGNTVWWAGFSSEAGLNDFHRGLEFTNVFHGVLGANGLTGDWADVPKGRTLQSGTLTLDVAANTLHRRTATGGFGASSWQRTGPPPAVPDIFTTFDRVKKNQNGFRDHTLLDSLKPAKPVAASVFGVMTPSGSDPDVMHVNYRTRDGRSYHDFICLDGNDSPPDGDIDFNIHIDSAELDAQNNFWSGPWETSHGITSDNFKAKLYRDNTLHVESIMYGGNKECGDDGSPSILLPGWQQDGSYGVLLNGRPIAGQLAMDDRDLSSSTVNLIRGNLLLFGMRVRLRGMLALDCGHGPLHSCDEDDKDTQNQEMHPVYAMDIVQDFLLPRPFASLGGVWAANDGGTYYVRQIGGTIWWLGLSPDEGGSFANVFHGSLQNGVISGDWADVPLGSTFNAGTIALAAPKLQSITLARNSETGGFSGQSWQKLYDVGTRLIIVGVDTATVGAVSAWPASQEPFEVTVAGQRSEVPPVNPRPIKLADGRPAVEAQLGARMQVQMSNKDPLPIALQYAGYRASWSIPPEQLKPGVYERTLKVPSAAALPVPARAAASDRDASAAGRLPVITVKYRIEVVEQAAGAQ